MTVSSVKPPSIAARKIVHLPKKPAVGGMPASDTRKSPNARAAGGCRRPTPARSS